MVADDMKWKTKYYIARVRIKCVIIHMWQWNKLHICKNKVYNILVGIKYYVCTEINLHTCTIQDTRINIILYMYVQYTCENKISHCTRTIQYNATCINPFLKRARRELADLWRRLYVHGAPSYRPRNENKGGGRRLGWRQATPVMHDSHVREPRGSAWLDESHHRARSVQLNWTRSQSVSPDLS